MSKLKVSGNASGTGVITLEAPNTNTDRAITLPDSAGTLLMTDGDGSNLTGLAHTPEGTAVLSTGETGATKFLREDGDGTCSWQSAGGNSPYFSVKKTSSQSIGDNSTTKITFSNNELDPDSVYDASTNYRFTVPSGQAGKYLLTVAMTFYNAAGGGMRTSDVELRKNGTVIGMNLSAGPGDSVYTNQMAATIVTIEDLSVSDYIEVFANTNTMDSSSGQVKGFFSGLKIG